MKKKKGKFIEVDEIIGDCISCQNTTDLAWCENCVQGICEQRDKADKILLDVVLQALTVSIKDNNGDNYIDNMCMATYEEATFYLTERGLLTKINDRIFKEKVNQ